MTETRCDIKIILRKKVSLYNIYVDEYHNPVICSCVCYNFNATRHVNDDVFLKNEKLRI